MSRKLVIEHGTLRKTAANQPGEGPSFEQQFGILANAQITDKYPMLGNYQISVQLLDKTDDNSFAVCAVVYKLGKNYVYVPAVFRNGKISTGQMMQVPSLQMFLPLSDAWMSWVKNKDVADNGQLIQSSMKDLYGEPASTARTRAPKDPLTKSSSLNRVSLFDTTLKLGKKASQKLMGYLCNTDFLNQTFRYYSPSQVVNFTKQAMAMYPDEAEVQIISVLDKKASLLSPYQKQRLFRDGFVVKKAAKVDWGPAENQVKVVKSTNISNTFITPSKPCKAKALLSDGTLTDITYLPITIADQNSFGHVPHPSTWGEPKWSSCAITSMINNEDKAVLIEGDHFYQLHIKPVVVQSSIKDLDISSIGKPLSSVSSRDGNIVIVVPSGQATMLCGCGEWKKDNDTLYSYFYVITESKDQSLKKIVKHNNTIEIPKGSRILVQDKSEDQPQEPPKNIVAIADLGKAINKFTADNYNKLKVTSDGQQISFTGEKSDASQRMQKTQAVVHLVKEYGICPQDAKNMVALAGRGTFSNPVTDSYLIFKEEALGQESNVWEPSDIGYSQIANEPPVVTQTSLNGLPDDDYNDAKQLETITKATEAGVKQVFDTATLKLLVNQADPHEQILQALPDFMKTLDQLCRLLFLYRCHTEDMEERYGAVKMKALQKSLENTIQDLSQLTIFLKLRGLNNGESPDAGDLQTGTLMQ